MATPTQTRLSASSIIFPIIVCMPGRLSNRKAIAGAGESTRRASPYFLEQPATEALEASALVLNSTSKVLTTSGLYLQKRAVDGLEDGFLFFGQGHHARKLEPVL